MIESDQLLRLEAAKLVYGNLDYFGGSYYEDTKKLAAFLIGDDE